MALFECPAVESAPPPQAGGSFAVTLAKYTPPTDDLLSRRSYFLGAVAQLAEAADCQSVE